jgi:hypothetical protein
VLHKRHHILVSTAPSGPTDHTGWAVGPFTAALAASSLASPAPCVGDSVHPHGAQRIVAQTETNGMVWLTSVAEISLAMIS